MVDIGSELEKYTFQFFLKQALSKVPSDIDSREGSIIYDAIAPACYELAESMLNLKNVMLESFTQTASGQYLDLKAEEVGLTRYPATNAIAKGRFLKQNGSPVEINIGDRFSTIGNSITYFKVTEWVEDGIYLLVSETAGMKGNEYIGTILPVSNYADMMEANLLEITVPARATETDEELRERVLKAHSNIAFGGNVADYMRYTEEIADISGCQIYPVWSGGGTVRIVILNNEYGMPSDSLVADVQAALDPTDYTQLGRGMAPIGHRVTVAAPTALTIDVSFSITLTPGVEIGQVESSIKQAIETYFLEVRHNWTNMQEDYSYSSWIFRSQIISAILLNVSGISNVQDVLLNGVEADIQLQLDNQKQELPLLGEVVIS